MVNNLRPNYLTSPFSLKINNFLVKIADSREEILAALKLRFEVFNVELNEGLQSSWDTGFDHDQFDKHADHLIVIEQTNNKVVGTYRMLLKSNVISNGGFYSEGEFDLSNIKNLPEQCLEMGRSCVSQEYRSSAVINLLWSGIIKYIEVTNTKYLFGCGSLHTHNVNEISEIYSYLEPKYLAEEKFRVAPHDNLKVKGLRNNISNIDFRQVCKKIPPLLKGYLRAGANICGEPAIDAEFGTTDFLIFLDTEKLTERYKKHYHS